MVAPLIMGAVLFLATRNILSIVFVALSPLIAVATYFDRRSTDKKAVAEDRKRFGQDMEDLKQALVKARAEEQKARCAEVLSLGAVLEAAFSQNPDLWHRHPEQRSFLEICLGYGTDTSRHTVVLPERGEAEAEVWGKIEQLHDQAVTIKDVPIVASLTACGNVGVSGVREWVDPVARNLVASRVCLSWFMAGRWWSTWPLIRDGSGRSCSTRLARRP